MTRETCACHRRNRWMTMGQAAEAEGSEPNMKRRKTIWTHESSKDDPSILIASKSSAPCEMNARSEEQAASKRSSSTDVNMVLISGGKISSTSGCEEGSEGEMAGWQTMMLMSSM